MARGTLTRKTVRLDAASQVEISVSKLDGKPPSGLSIVHSSVRSVSLSPRKAREIAAALVLAAEFVEAGKA